MKILRWCLLGLLAIGCAWACGFDNSLREYLNAQFWLPFAKAPRHFGDKKISRASAAFAGMKKTAGDAPLAKLRDAYQLIGNGDLAKYDGDLLATTLEAAKQDKSLTPREQEEVRLLDAKIDMRTGSVELPAQRESARKKLIAFLQTARVPEYRSEARGWLAHIYYSLGNQTAAGKIYLDELNRKGSNLSEETLVNSLNLTYGYDGGSKLAEHLDDYFDTPEHAAFAIQLITNPRWDRTRRDPGEEREAPVTSPPPYERIHALLEQHRDLLHSVKGADLLAMLGMRTALRAGDPPGALRIAEAVPANAPTRNDSEFNWMLASAHFLSHDYAAAAGPLLRVFQSARSTDDQKAGAAYGLCGVYQKTGNPVEQIRFALWLEAGVRGGNMYLSHASGIENRSVYWAISGWDLGLLLDAQAPVEALRSFLRKYPRAADIRLVKYSLAVRLARENRYEESAGIYESINEGRRASRMRILAALYAQSIRPDVPASQRREAKYKMAEYLSANQERIYFNAAVWDGLEKYALHADSDSRLTLEERNTLMAAERKLQDQQEERWRAYLLVRDVVRESGHTELARKAAELGLQCLRRISPRFEREEDIHKADLELALWLRQSGRRK